MAIVKELKNLGKKMTGSDLTGNTVSEALKAIEEKYTGGSGETYETVAEIEVGEMFEYEGQYIAQTDIPFPTASESDTFYLNTTDNPNDGFMTDKGEVLGILWNCTGSEEGPVPIDPNKPYVACAVSDGKIALVSDTNDLSNTTVRILKKASAPSGGELPEVSDADNGKIMKVVDGAWDKAEPESDRFVVTLTKTGTGSKAVYSADKTFSEIKEALDAKKDVEVLHPYDFDGELTDPLVVHLYPLGYQAINETVSLIGFASLPTYSEVGFSSASVTCQYNSTTEETTWNVAFNKIGQPKEFSFTATPDGQGGFTVTPAAGVTYANILDAMASSPLVFAHISVPAIDTTVIARFNSKNSVSGNGNVTASIMGYVNGAYCLMELYMRSDGTNGVNVVPIPTQS